MKINGNLFFHTLGDGEIQNAIIERVAGEVGGSSLPSTTVAGRICYNTDDDLYYYHNGTSWTPFSTGGDASALEAIMDALVGTGSPNDGALGDMVNADGTANTINMNNLTNVTDAESISDVLAQLDAAVSGKDQLSELLDVTIGSPLSDGDFLRYDNGTSMWINTTSSLSDLSDVADVSGASIEDILAFDGTEWTAITPATFAADITLADISDVVAGSPGTIDTNDLLQWDGDSWEAVAIGSGSGIQAYDAALDALSNVGGTGILVQTGVDTFVTRSIVESTTTALTITNGDGVSGDPSIAIDATLDGLAALAPSSADRMIYASGVDTFAYTTLTPYARDLLDDADEATMRTTLGMVAGGDGDIWVEKAGDTMTGDLTITDGQFIYSPATAGYSIASNDNVVVNKAYVDSLVAGLSWKDAVRAAADTSITLSGEQTIDGVAVVDGDRVLVMGNGNDNGIYVASTGAWTRATDMDDGTEFDGAAVFVQEGTTYESTGWTQTASVGSPITGVTFSQFTGGAVYTWGTGLGSTGNNIYVNFGAGITELPNDAIGIDLANGTALSLTPEGSPYESDQLTLNVDDVTVQQTSGELAVKANSISETYLTTSVAGAGLTGGNGTALSVVVDNTTIEIVGDTLEVKDGGITPEKLSASVAGEGLSLTENGSPTNASLDVNVDGTTIAITTDTLGVVQGGIDFGLDSDDASPSTVNLDQTLTINGGTGITTSHSGQTVTVTRDAMASSDLTDVSAAATTAGQMLVSNGTTYTPKQVAYAGSSSSAGTSFTFDHNLGTEFVNVTVFDSVGSPTSTPGEVIIPQSITIDDANNVTVTFNTAIECHVAIMGIADVTASSVDPN